VMEVIFQGELTLVRRFKTCCRCGSKTEMMLPQRVWGRFRKAKGMVVCSDCLKASDSEEEREMYAKAPGVNLVIADEPLFEEPIQDDYSKYLQSEHWQETRLKALERAQNRCQVCNSPDDLHVHHRTYDNIGKEPLEDLIVLCRPCHYLFHKRRCH
jgi:hypothetical protein